MTARRDECGILSYMMEMIFINSKVEFWTRCFCLFGTVKSDGTKIKSIHVSRRVGFVGVASGDTAGTLCWDTSSTTKKFAVIRLTLGRYK